MRDPRCTLALGRAAQRLARHSNVSRLRPGERIREKSELLAGGPD